MLEVLNRGGEKRGRMPSSVWASIELLVALSIIYAGLKGYAPFSSAPWLLAAAIILLWWRGPTWKEVGLRKPTSIASTVFIGVLAGVGYQFLGIYVLEPLIARATSGQIPDVSLFRPLIGDTKQLLFWLAMTWTLAAFMEEMVYRGWILTRIAELGKFSSASWFVAALISSALFGAAHLYQGVSGVISTGLSGFLFAILYLATGRNLWASIVAHGMLDTAGFVMIYFGVYPGL